MIKEKVLGFLTLGGEHLSGFSSPRRVPQSLETSEVTEFAVVVECL